MRYTNTSKTLCLIFHAILAVLFGVLAIFLLGFILPGFYSGNTEYINFRTNIFSSAYVLYLELAVLSTTIAVLSGTGFASALSSFNSGDKDVVKSFASFITEGWIASIFVLLQGVVFFNLISNETNIAFVIVMAIVLTIGLLIATNIPMVKLFDGKDIKPLFEKFYLAGTVVGCVLFLIPTLSLVLASGPVSDNFTIVNRIQVLLALVALVGLALCVPSAYSLIASRGGKAVAHQNVAYGVGTMVAGGAVVAAGVLSIVWKGFKCHIASVNDVASSIVRGGEFPGYGLAVMVLILGAVLIIGSFFVLVGSKKPSAK